MPAPRRIMRRTARRTTRRVARRQQAMAAPSQAPSQEPAAPAPPHQAAQVDPYEELKKLAELHDQGILTDDEFAAAKAKILG